MQRPGDRFCSSVCAERYDLWLLERTHMIQPEDVVEWPTETIGTPIIPPRLRKERRTERVGGTTTRRQPRPRLWPGLRQSRRRTPSAP